MWNNRIVWLTGFRDSTVTEKIMTWVRWRTIILPWHEWYDGNTEFSLSSGTKEMEQHISDDIRIAVWYSMWGRILLRALAQTKKNIDLITPIFVNAAFNPADAVRKQCGIINKKYENKLDKSVCEDLLKNKRLWNSIVQWNYEDFIADLKPSSPFSTISEKEKEILARSICFHCPSDIIADINVVHWFKTTIIELDWFKKIWLWTHIPSSNDYEKIQDYILDKIHGTM